MRRNRAFFARSFCSGRGIEIGALHHPTEMPPEAQVRYVDRLSNEELRRHYPELEGQPLVPLDVIDDGETLGLLSDGTEDFVLACQFIEHCRNPVRALVNMLRVVRDRKFVLITVPDKRQTFDIDRPITSNEHLLDECLHGAERNTRQHYREWASLVEKVEDSELEARVDKLMENGYSIHYHVWDFDAFIKFLMFIKEKFQLPFEIFSVWQNGMELMVSLRKMLPVAAAPRPEFPMVAKY